MAHEVRVKVWGSTFKRMRVKAGWTQERLGAALGFSQEHLSQVENGLRGPLSVDQVRRASELMGLRFAQIAKLNALARSCFVDGKRTDFASDEMQFRKDRTKSFERHGWGWAKGDHI